MNERIAAEMFPPGELIEEELEARGWSKGDLASIMGRPPQLVSAIINNKRAITIDTAEDLAAAFGTSAEFWINLDTSYRLWQKRVNDRSDDREPVRRKSQIYSIAPVNDMIRRHWISDAKGNVDELEREVLEFLQIDAIGKKPAMKFAARKSTDELNYSHAAWFRRAHDLASILQVQRYTEQRLHKAVNELKQLALNAEDIRHVSDILTNAGVCFVIVEHLPRTKIDGAAFWLDENEPAIVLSLRYGRLDCFWHTLGHEIGHILARDIGSLDNDMINDSLQNAGDLSDSERAADDFAVQMLIPQDKLQSFIARKGRYFSKRDISGFAKVIGVHPGIVVGQLQYRNAIKWTHSREMLVNVRETVTGSALTDGWGKMPSV